MKTISTQQIVAVSGGSPTQDEIAIFSGLVGAAIGSSVAVVSDPPGYVALVVCVLLGIGAGGGVGYGLATMT
jgi:hypothetical protein